MVDVLVCFVSVVALMLWLVLRELRNITPCPLDCIDCEEDRAFNPPCVVCEKGNWSTSPGSLNYLCDKHVPGGKMCHELPTYPEIKKALSEQGASDDYMRRVKEQLCGSYGRVMP